jgi:hypothetical protein
LHVQLTTSQAELEAKKAEVSCKTSLAAQLQNRLDLAHQQILEYKHELAQVAMTRL